jgi:hypothetical protein
MNRISSKKRTELDVMFRMIEEVGGPLMVEAFKRDVLPHLTPNPIWYKEVSDAEFAFAVQKIKEETPEFIRFLTQNNWPLPSL